MPNTKTGAQKLILQNYHMQTQASPHTSLTEEPHYQKPNETMTKYFLC